MEKIFAYIKYLLSRKITFILNAILATLFALFYVLQVVEVEYASSFTFFPPYKESNMFGIVSGKLGGGGITTTVNIVPQQISTIFYSQDFRRKIVDKFNLIEHYEQQNTSNPMGLTLKQLKGNLSIEVEELGSLGASTPISYTITFFDTDPQLAHKGAQYIYTTLDSTIRSISSIRGIKETEHFLSQLMNAHSKLDSLNSSFISFKLDNKIVDIPNQVTLTLENYTTLKSSLSKSLMQLQELKSEYNIKTPQIKRLEDKIAFLNKEIEKLESNSSNEFIGGIEEKTTNLPLYENYTREIRLQNELVLLLSHQYEKSLMKAANKTSSLELIDPPLFPEYKARPKRAVVLLFVFGLYMSIVLIIVSSKYFYKELTTNSRNFNELVKALKSWK